MILGALAVLTVLAWTAVLTRDRAEGAPSASGAALEPDGGATDVPTLATTNPTVTSGPPPTPTAPPTPEPTPTAVPTAEPAPPEDARLAYAAFLSRLNDARAKAEALNASLRAAGETGSSDGVRSVAVEILDFVDEERDWLRDHPPAACYADAHASAQAMVTAYGTVGEESLRWAAAEGLDVVAALAAVYEAAEAATVAAGQFGDELQAASCPS